MHVNKEAVVPGAYLNFPIGYNSENFIRNIFLIISNFNRCIR